MRQVREQMLVTASQKGCGCVVYWLVTTSVDFPRQVPYFWTAFFFLHLPTQEFGSPTLTTPPPPTPQYNISRDRERRQVIPPKRYVEVDLVAYAPNVVESIGTCEEPSTYEETVSYKDSSRWMSSMHEEMEFPHKNGTWDLVKLPEEKKVVRCKWVFKRKEGILGVEEARYKASLVVKGYSQIQGIDFTNEFSLVVNHSSIRTLFNIMAIHILSLSSWM